MEHKYEPPLMTRLAPVSCNRVCLPIRYLQFGHSLQGVPADSTNSADLIGTSRRDGVFNGQSSLHAFSHETNAFDGTKLLCISLLAAIFSLVDPHLDLLDQTEILSHRSVARCLHRPLELLDVSG